VVAGAWLAGWATAVAQLNTVTWLAALAAGLGLRLRDARRHATTEAVRRDERLALARELHDVVAHHITGVVLQAQATRIVARTRPDDVDGSLAGIEAAGSEALTAMRRLVGVLRDDDDAAPATPGPEGLAALVARFDGHGPAVRLRLPDDPPGWPPEVTSTVYRIVQEALTNVARHAPHAGAVTVDVAQERDAVTVEVADDAPPAPVRRPHRTGYGLVGMRERVETLGGTLRAGPRPGAGWSVRATLPVTAREAG
jgi:signal transduction histidine kinase